ncbi:MAG: hypothetical protein KBH41_16680 [Azonexus sp.]|nr:hypothetical protein [Azonexus sp.]
MATIEVAAPLKRNFSMVLQDRFGPQKKQVPSFDQAIASRGIDAKRAISNMRRRANYHQYLDRPKFFSDTKAGDLTCYPPYVRESYRKSAEQDMVTLKHTTDTAAYVGAWCRLNHLKEV